MNHCCFANTLTTNWGFEIAVRDIQPNEEITDDYGLFTIRHEMKISCEKENCRGRVSIDDFTKNAPHWNQQIGQALVDFVSVDQPLANLLTPEVLESVRIFVEQKESYACVNSTPQVPEEYFN